MTAQESDEEFALRAEAEYEQHRKDCATTDSLEKIKRG
jgi:hypothetical protein